MLERKKIHEAIPVRPTWLWYVMWCGMMIALMSIPAIFKVNDFTMTLAIIGFLGFLGTPIVAIFLMANRGKSATRQVENSHVFLDYIGPNHKNIEHIEFNAVFNENGATIDGIAIIGSTLYMVEKGVAVTIPWSAIRSWTWSIEGYSEVKIYGGQPGTNHSASMDNARAEAEARKASGIFITVADVGKPVWQFTTTDKTVCERWMEILRQVNEKMLAATPAGNPEVSTVTATGQSKVRAFCSACGSKVEEESNRFCGACGAAVA